MKSLKAKKAVEAKTKCTPVEDDKDKPKKGNSELKPTLAAEGEEAKDEKEAKEEKAKEEKAAKPKEEAAKAEEKPAAEEGEKKEEAEGEKKEGEGEETKKAVEEGEKKKAKTACDLKNNKPTKDAETWTAEMPEKYISGKLSKGANKKNICE